MHWGLSGAPDRWAGRGWFGVYGTLLFGALLITLLLVFAEAILRASPRARTPESAGWTARFRRANLRLIMATVWGVSAMLALTSLAPLFMQGGRAP